MTEKRIHSNLAIPPGEFLEEVLEDLVMTKEEFSNRMNRPSAKLSLIFSGAKAITPDTAIQIEKVTGVPAHIWTGLEADYRLTLAKAAYEKEEERLKEETKLIKKFQYTQLQKLGVVEKQTKPIDKVKELHKYFGVTSLRNLASVKRYAALYRHQNSDKNKAEPEALSSWLRMGEIKGITANCVEYSRDKAEKIADEIKELTLIKNVNIKEYLEDKFAQAGIALAIVPHLEKTYAHGAAFWLKDKPVIMVTIRKSWGDIFWFSLLHEMGHILLHSKSEIFIESDSEKHVSEIKEKEADKFASQKLIPNKEYNLFKQQGSFYAEDITRFAKKINIHPGIVVGRLQHEKLIPQSWHNSLRERFIWKE